MPASQDPPTYHGPAIPSELGTELAAAMNLESCPATLGDWARALGRFAEREEIEISRDVLCTTTQSPHRAEFNDQIQHYQCVQDAFLVPYLVDAVNTVDVTTESPVDGTRIDITAGTEGIEVDPPGAVMSIGVAADAAGTTETVSAAYDKICPYGQAFPDRSAYQTWAESVDAVTMVTPIEDALPFARTLVNAV